MKNVCAGYWGKEVLHDISLELETGKITVVIGPNGCGKSTLMKALIRLNPHTKGEIIVGEKSIEQLDSVALAQKIAYLPQSKRTPDITVMRMVLHGRFAYLKYPRRYKKEDYEMAEKAMKWVGIENLADKNMNELSGGTQQKVYIAMALAQDTPVILLDEPTAYLDISHQLKMMELARKLSDEGKAVVMVLHDLGHAFQVADKIIVMCDGKICACGAPDEIYERGVVDKIFDVNLKKVKVEEQWAYVCL